MEFKIHIERHEPAYKTRSWDLVIKFPNGPMKNIKFSEPYLFTENEIDKFLCNKRSNLSGGGNSHWYLTRSKQNENIFDLYFDISGCGGGASIHVELYYSDVCKMLNIIKDVNKCVTEDERYYPAENVNVYYDDDLPLVKQAK